MHRQLVCLLLLLLCWLTPAYSQTDSFHALLDQAQIKVLVDGQTEAAILGNRKLPWRSDFEFNRRDGIAHFDFQFQLTESQWQNLQTNEAGLGLFGLQLGSRYRFRFNQSPWVETNWTEANQYRARPRWHLIPRSHIQGQALNRLEIEVRFAAASDSGLSTIEIGEVQHLLSKYQRESNYRYFSALFAGVASLLIGLLALAMWLASRERFFALTGVAEIIFALRQTGIFIDCPPLPTWLWNSLYGQFFATYVGLICLASLELRRVPTPIMPVLKRTIHCFLIVSVPLVFIGHWIGEYRAYLMCLAMMLALTFICVVYISMAAWRTKDVNTRLFTLGAWIALLLGLHDFMVVSTVATGLGHFRFGVFSSVLFNLSLAVIIVRRYQTANQNMLRSQLTAKNDTERATLLERQRIMSDIHDTVGSQLVSVLGMIRSGAPHSQLESETAGALEDLRIAIDAIQPVNGDLAAVLATLRHRLEPRVEAHGLALIWQVDALPKFKHMTTQTVQHVQRIILEAMTNTLKHAHASRITLSAKVQTDGSPTARSLVVICIADDGLGFREPLLQAQGQGLSNIRMRAAQINARVLIESAALKGTYITLSLAVDE